MVGHPSRDLGGAAREHIDRREAELGPGVDGDVAFGEDDHAARPVGQEAREPRVDDMRAAVTRRLLERSAEPFEVVESRGRDTVEVEEDVGSDRVFDAHACLRPYQVPVLAIESHGSAGASAAPCWRSSMETPSGERTNAIRPSRGGRLTVTPAAMSFRQVS